MTRVYMDHNATTPLDERVQNAMSDVMANHFGNPSSVHLEGRQSRSIIEDARISVGKFLAASSDELVFTSGGTESDMLGILGLAQLAASQNKPKRAIVAPIAHPAIHGSLAQLQKHGWQIDPLQVDANGRVDPGDLEAQCKQGASLVCLSLANHELGVLQDVEQLAYIAREQNAYVHCDAVQAAGKVPICVGALNVDTLAISAHKFYGPKGVGVLWSRSGLTLPSIAAGHQERGRRPGTENLIGIAGLGVAATIAGDEGPDQDRRLAVLRDTLQDKLSALPGCRLYGHKTKRVGNTLSVGFDGALGEIVVAGLDLEGIAVSTGAACTSGTTAPSPVLLGIGVSEQKAQEVVRISLGRANTSQDIETLMDKLPPILQKIRAHT